MFEAYEKGLVNAEDCDGLRLEWGNVEAIDKLLEMTARRQGKWGNLIADGPLEVAEAIGGDAVKWVVHTKRGVPAMHDWRPHFSNMLREIVASGGMKPQGGGHANPPPDFKYREKWGPLDRDDPKGWPQSNVHRRAVPPVRRPHGRLLVRADAYETGRTEKHRRLIQRDHRMEF